MSESTSEPPPPYAKDPQPDTNVSPPQPPPRAHRWQNRQPSIDHALNTTQPSATVMPMPFPMDSNYAQFTRNCHHQWTTQFGLCGIFCAIVCFPIGLPCLLFDRQEVCVRCGARRLPGF